MCKGYKPLCDKDHGGDETHILQVKDELENLEEGGIFCALLGKSAGVNTYLGDGGEDGVS